MLSVSEISIAPTLAAGALDRKDPQGIAAEFDAMVLEFLLQQSGLLRSFGTEEGGESAMFGEMFLPQLARQLAAQMDLGFGRLLMSQAQPNQGEVAK